MGSGLSSSIRHELDRAADELRRRYRLRPMYPHTSRFYEWTDDSAKACEASIRRTLSEAASGHANEAAARGLLERAQELCAQGRLV